MTNEQPTKRDGKLKAASRESGRNPLGLDNGAANVTARQDIPIPKAVNLMEAVVETENVAKALRRVEGNKGAPGIDNMTVEQLRPFMQTYWATIKAALLEGDYKPQPVKAVEIPKPDGGTRRLGIPTVLDRLIQQAMLQVLSPIFDPHFSQQSYGFRPCRSAHQAVKQSQTYVAGGKCWVVDLDLEKFFDRVNHDILMSRVARRIDDKRLLLLVRRYLQAGIMSDGLTLARTEGTPQGGPLSPLLSNIMLDELDKELERRGHAFCRYADDCNIYVKSSQAGKRVFESISQFLWKKLKLKINPAKSAVGRPRDRKFLGYTITAEKEPRLRIAKESISRFRKAVKELFRQGKGQNIGRFIQEKLNPLIRGWGNYFCLNRVKTIIETLDSWIRRRLRRVLWVQWKRFHTRKKRLVARGLGLKRAELSAGNGHGSWWNAGASHMNEAFPKKYFDAMRLITLREIMVGL